MDMKQAVAEYSKVTFEDYWASLQETRRLIEEVGRKQEETARQMEETDRRMEETARQMKETDKKIGNLYNRFGEIAEHLVAPNIHLRFNELGYHFGAYSPGGYKLEDGKGKLLAEIDILLENSEYFMAVEVKTKPDLDDIEPHLKRMQILREARDKFNDHRKIQGAIAGAIFGSNVKKEAIKAGLYVIEQSGDTMKITVPDGFIPREW